VRSIHADTLADMMATYSATIYIFWLAAVAGPAAHLGGVEAAMLRSRAPRITPKGSNGAAAREQPPSPALEEEVLDEEDDDDQPASSIPSILSESLPSVPQQEVQAAMPQQTEAPEMESSQPIPVVTPQWAAPEITAADAGLLASLQQLPAVARAPLPQWAVPGTFKLPATVPEPEAVFQFSAPPASLPVLGGRAAAASKPIPSWLQSNASLQEGAPKIPWPPSNQAYTSCDPPCIQGRGICNDNVCFCRSPFAGSTCQHKQTDLYRAPKIMVVGFAAVCFGVGILMSKLMFSFSEHAIETRLEKYGAGKRRYELWAPPEDSKKKKGGGG